MRITYFKIENFRNITLAECSNPPDFMVICGGNGCGKSAFLSALMTAKEYGGGYGSFEFDPRVVSADAQMARICLRLSFNDIERQWHQEKHKADCPQEDEVVVEIQRGGVAHVSKRSLPVSRLLGWYSKEYLASPGFFDYIGAYRTPTKKQLNTWNAESLSDEHFKHTLSIAGQGKFAFTKEYLASLVLRDAQHLMASKRAGTAEFRDSLMPIREFFNSFFRPMEFVDVQIHTSPFSYIIRTPRGEIDIDDMSAGEKEILNTFIRFHQLRPKGAVILFDEADAHLHPDLERRYLEVLKQVSEGNQLWLTTHSPEMMIAARADALYTVLKEPPAGGGNQFVRVSTTDALHEALSEIMGSRGLVSFNQRIIFIEGDESSTDRCVYEHFYPPGHYNVSFVPAGNSATVRKTAERVNELMTAGIRFQQYFSIVDGDIDRALPAVPGGRLHQLPVYHVENLLLDEGAILQATRDLMAGTCPYTNPDAVVDDMRSLLLSDKHLKPYASALRDARLARLAKQAWDAVYNGQGKLDAAFTPPEFPAVQEEARRIMATAGENGTWKAKCKGRDLLKAYCAKHGFPYVQFRNLVMSKLKEPPPELKQIMDKIINA